MLLERVANVAISLFVEILVSNRRVPALASFLNALHVILVRKFQLLKPVL